MTRTQAGKAQSERAKTQHSNRAISTHLRDANEAVRAEGALRVYVKRLALRAAGVDRKLRSHTERMADLRLAGAEFSEELRDGARLHATAQQVVELARAGGDLSERHITCA